MKIISNTIKAALIVGAAAILPVAAQAAAITSSLASTKHDLSATTGSNGEICVFCHTPHGGSNAIGAPLWNKAVGLATDYTPYTSTTLDGTAALDGSPSLACLSCHDGRQALDAMYNAPTVASGVYNTSATPAPLAALGVMTNANATEAPMLGVSLANDHPIAVPYAGGGLDATLATGLYFDDGFAAAQGQLIGGKQSWWIDTLGTTTNTRDKNDIILYSRDNTAVAGSPLTGFVECGSCHDPHSSNDLFLRSALGTGNADSQICLACHTK